MTPSIPNTFSRIERVDAIFICFFVGGGTCRLVVAVVG